MKSFLNKVRGLCAVLFLITGSKAFAQQSWFGCDLYFAYVDIPAQYVFGTLWAPHQYINYTWTNGTFCPVVVPNYWSVQDRTYPSPYLHNEVISGAGTPAESNYYGWIMSIQCIRNSNKYTLVESSTQSENVTVYTGPEHCFLGSY